MEAKGKGWVSKIKYESINCIQYSFEKQNPPIILLITQNTNKINN